MGTKEDMELMTQECFTECLECRSVAVGEHRQDKLKRFAKEHPEMVAYHREIFPQGTINAPDWKLVEPPACFIIYVCCACCEKNHKDIWDMCQQARMEYEKDLIKEV